jgi:hypothetical protein
LRTRPTSRPAICTFARRRQPMSRVEPKDDRRDAPREAEPTPRRLSDRKSEKAEGDEVTIEEALKNQESKS